MRAHRANKEHPVALWPFEIRQPRWSQVAEYMSREEEEQGRARGACSGGASPHIALETAVRPTICPALDAIKVEPLWNLERSICSSRSGFVLKGHAVAPRSRLNSKSN